MNKKIKILNIETSKVFEASIFLNSADDEFLLEFNSQKNINKSFSSSVNYYKCFVDFKDWLYSYYNCFVMCSGALLNVYPSRMSLQMSKGLKAYSLELGKQAQETDLVDIFENIKNDNILNLASSKEQEEFFKRWLKSLKNAV